MDILYLLRKTFLALRRQVKLLSLCLCFVADESTRKSRDKILSGTFLHVLETLSNKLYKQLSWVVFYMFASIEKFLSEVQNQCKQIQKKHNPHYNEEWHFEDFDKNDYLPMN